MLAQSEVTSAISLGIASDLKGLLTDGPLPAMEVELRLRQRRVTRSIANLDGAAFARDLWSYVEAMAHLSENRQQFGKNFDLFNPVRMEIPSLPFERLSDPSVSRLADDAVLAYAAATACSYSAELLIELGAFLTAEFGDFYPGASLLARANATVPLASPSSFEEASIDEVRGGSGNLVRCGEWSFCLTAAKVAADREKR